MTQALYRSWRPQRWDQVVGQEHIVQTLRNAVAADKMAHAYLFAGPRGTGKTTTARVLAKAANCLAGDLARRPCDECEHCTAVNQGRFLDLIEIDAASNTSVDDVRDLRDKINFSPNRGQFKVYIVDEVHMLSTAAFNALLKTLEEPPPHAMFILATTEIHKIPATVLSRCQRYEFRRIPQKEIVAHLRRVAEAEKLNVEDAALELIARQATGAMRDAISLLDQLASTGREVSLEFAQAALGTAASQSVIDLVQAILDNQVQVGLERVHSALDAGSDPRQLARQVVDYLRNLLLVKVGGAEQLQVTNELRLSMGRQASAFTTQDLLRLVRIFNQAANEARSAWQPALPMELAVLEALQAPDEPAAAQPAPQPAAPAAASQRSAPPAAPAKTTRQERAPAQQISPAPEEDPEESDAEILPLKQIKKQWNQVVSLVNAQNQTAAAVLRSGKLLGIKDGVLVFGVSEVLKEKLEKAESANLVQQALQQVFQTPVRLRCVVSTGQADSMPAEVDSDGMVAAALRDLGGEIVDVQ